MLCFEGGGTGVATFGFLDREYTYDKPSFLKLYGKLVLNGSHHDFAPGTILYVGSEATVTIDDGFTVSHDAKFYIKRSLTIGRDNMWSYYNIIMDNDGHKIYDENGVEINKNRGIVFGDHVWMGCRCTVLKGAQVADNCVIATGSIVKGVHRENNSIISSNKEPIRKTIIWDRTLQ